MKKNEAVNKARTGEAWCRFHFYIGRLGKVQQQGCWVNTDEHEGARGEALASERKAWDAASARTTGKQPGGEAAAYASTATSAASRKLGQSREKEGLR